MTPASAPEKIRSSTIAPASRAVLASAAAFLAFTSISSIASAAEGAVATPAAEEKVVLGPPPSDFALKFDYYADSQQVISFSCTEGAGSSLASPSCSLTIVRLGCRPHEICHSDGEGKP